MITISVKSDIKEVVGKLAANMRQQVPYATVQTLNTVARIAETDTRKEMVDVFDRPTPWTLNSTFVKPASKSTLAATIGLKDARAVSTGVPAAKYLKTEITGGERRLKRFERALRSVGALPEGMFIVPGSGVKLDPYGNVPTGVVVQILSYFRAFPDAGYKANITDARKAKLARGTRNQSKLGVAFFVGRPADGKLPLGIWQRTYLAGGTAIKPLFIFVNGVNYEPRFDFRYVIELAVQRHFSSVFKAELQDAMRTAR